MRAAVDATRRQRVSRALILMLVGVTAGLLASFDPARALRTPAFVLMALGMCAWTIAENLVLQQDEPRKYRGRANTRFLQAVMMVVVFVGVVDLFHLQLLARPRWLTAFGFLVLASGAIIRVAAIRTLAEHFRYELRVEKGQGLVRDGLYSKVRHPSYLGLLLLTVGAALTLQSVPAALLGVLLLTPVLIARMVDEERVLSDAFGEDYERYRSETWRLVPYIY